MYHHICQVSSSYLERSVPGTTINDVTVDSLRKSMQRTLCQKATEHHMISGPELSLNKKNKVTDND